MAFNLHLLPKSHLSSHDVVCTIELTSAPGIETYATTSAIATSMDRQPRTAAAAACMGLFQLACLGAQAALAANA